ncbi:hypothetical protein RFM41_09475 [Mesorhizobium sp. VK25A]|uniref:Uncharacterized protein n=1 Tax=Mesorhizobium vachelliae TaxID=3072309 RepID=A0ABU5A1P9_9HYPH|nr:MULTISPECIES: hypothetical protein [unclassified Mesorhizobium]MDX8531590.1 hypothetical protein [Mesorhizobium sp. VK25D]MDX8543967.1 hypothetical protein [Mesorhizobium sp. VK25A]
MDLKDERWSDLRGGYKVVYDPRPALRALALRYDDKSLWDQLWEELHHQGDVGDASYAAIPEIVRISAEHVPANWATYGLAAVIEEARRTNERNPPIPDWVEPHYRSAWQTLFHLALRDLANTTDEATVIFALAIVAFHHGQVSLARMTMCTDDEREEMLTQYFGR